MIFPLAPSCQAHFSVWDCTHRSSYLVTANAPVLESFFLSCCFLIPFVLQCAELNIFRLIFSHWALQCNFIFKIYFLLFVLSILPDNFIGWNNPIVWEQQGLAAPEGKVSQELTMLDKAVSIQTRALSCFPQWRSRASLDVVFRCVHHGKVGPRSGWKFSLHVRSESVGYMTRHRRRWNRTQARTKGKNWAHKQLPSEDGPLLKLFHSSLIPHLTATS